jgi:hypothetical protein
MVNKTFPRTFTLFEGSVAGYQFYQGPVVISQLRTGDPLVLRREPDNPHDEWAIEVLTTSGAKLGYVPRSSNEVIAELLDQGLAVKAEIDYLDPDTDDPGEAIYFHISFQALVEVKLEACPHCGSTRRLPDGRCVICWRNI